MNRKLIYVPVDMVLANDHAENSRMEAILSRDLFPFLVEHIEQRFNSNIAISSVCNLVVDDVDPAVERLLKDVTVEEIEDALKVCSICVCMDRPYCCVCRTRYVNVGVCSA